MRSFSIRTPERSPPPAAVAGHLETFLARQRSKLVERFGWTIQEMMQRYVRLAEICLVALAILYIIGIVRTRAAVRSS